MEAEVFAVKCTLILPKEPVCLQKCSAALLSTTQYAEVSNFQVPPTQIYLSDDVANEGKSTT